MIHDWNFWIGITIGALVLPIIRRIRLWWYYRSNRSFETSKTWQMKDPDRFK